MYNPLPSFLTIKESNIHGLGIFAKEEIKKGTELGISLIHLPEEFMEEVIRTPLGGFYNHSDNPNIKAITFSKGSLKFTKLVTIKDITKDEEIVGRYTMYTPS